MPLAALAGTVLGATVQLGIWILDRTGGSPRGALNLLGGTLGGGVGGALSGLIAGWSFGSLKCPSVDPRLLLAAGVLGAVSLLIGDGLTITRRRCRV